MGEARFPLAWGLSHLLAGVLTLAGASAAFAQSAGPVDDAGPLDELLLRPALSGDETDDEAGAGGAPQALPINDGIATRLTDAAVADDGEAGPGPAGRTNVAQGVVEPGSPAVDAGDPFEPIGMRMGSLLLFPRLTQSIGVASNSAYSAGGEAGLISRTEAELELRSDWARHQLTVTAAGEYTERIDADTDPIPQAAVDGELRFDLRNGFSLAFGSNYEYATESASSANLSSSVDGRAGAHEFGGYVELERDGGKLDFTLRGSAGREVYENATLIGGGVLDQSDRNLNAFGVSARLGYGASPAFQPFVEAGIATDVHDLALDRNGQRRDSVTVGLRGGVEIDLNEKLTGEVAIGYSRQSFEDDAIEDLAGITVDGTLNWSPERDSNVALTLSTDLGGSTQAGQNGSVAYGANLVATRRVRANLEVNATAGVDYTSYDSLGRTDTLYTVGVGVDHWFNRFVALSADAEYQALESSAAGTSYESTTITMGLTMRR